MPFPRRDRRTRRSASPKCSSASSRAPAARSGCRGCAARRWRSTMCTGGKPVAAPKALAAGIIDHVVDGSLLDGAIAFAKAKAAAGEIRKVREIAHRRRTGDARGSRRAPRCARRSRRPREALQAPFAVVDAIEAGLQNPFDAGSVRERELFADCVVSTESKALRHLFFAERDVAKVPDVPKDTPARDDHARRGDRRRHDGRRHHDDLRERRHPGAAQGCRRCGAAARARDDPQELRRHDVQGQDDRRAGREDDGAHHADDDVRRLRPGGHRRRGGVREHGPEEGDVRRARQGDAARLRAGVELLHARHRRVRAGERPADAGDRPSLLQPGERDEAARDRPRHARRARR